MKTGIPLGCGWALLSDSERSPLFLYEISKFPLTEIWIVKSLRSVLKWSVYTQIIRNLYVHQTKHTSVQTVLRQTRCRWYQFNVWYIIQPFYNHRKVMSCPVLQVISVNGYSLSSNQLLNIDWLAYYKKTYDRHCREIPKHKLRIKWRK